MLHFVWADIHNQLSTGCTSKSQFADVDADCKLPGETVVKQPWVAVARLQARWLWKTTFIHGPYMSMYVHIIHINIYYIYTVYI